MDNYWDWIFEKYQKQILQFLNTSEGRRAQGLLPIYDHLPVVQVSRNHVTFWTGSIIKGHPELVGVFYTGDGFGGGRNLGTAIDKSVLSKKEVSLHSFRHYLGLYRDKFFPEIYLLTTPFTGGAKDGCLQRYGGSDSTWTLARDATTATDVINGAITDYVAAVKQGSLYEVRWNSMPVDTSGLT